MMEASREWRKTPHFFYFFTYTLKLLASFSTIHRLKITTFGVLLDASP